ncbi:GspE/PulE family protein [Flexibacterium corallicola]|uniref:GspE/PulE family protein n=1 Tax=Flexibacterium corallicola TaxID=3037259 RepID=UPI00286F7435|nr:ATPase, T2SS/T4P/T4SS family [Pseudovibrio sp. M1P-2-3]
MGLNDAIRSVFKKSSANANNIVPSNHRKKNGNPLPLKNETLGRKKIAHSAATGKKSVPSKINRARVEAAPLSEPNLPQIRSPHASAISKFHTPRDDQLLIIRNYTGPVHTLKGGIAEVNGNLCNAICIIGKPKDNLIVLLDKKRSKDEDVLLQIVTLTRKRIRWFKAFLVEEHIIRTLNDRSIRLGEEDNANEGVERQREFLEIIDTAFRNGATDVHFEVKNLQTRIEGRIDGHIIPLRELPAADGKLLLGAAFNMADEADANYTPSTPQGARISATGSDVSLPNNIQALRLQFNPQSPDGFNLSVRILPMRKDSSNDIVHLGFDAYHMKDISIMRKHPEGAVIIAGPTGSGKSTTLKNTLGKIMEEQPGKRTLTIEDPPEYEIPRAVQIPVTNADTSSKRREAFNKAIGSALRSDPDIIMIGEIRDKESGTLAMEAANTGHSVWSSLHANDAFTILIRLREMQISPSYIYEAGIVRGLIGQRLAPVLDTTKTINLKVAVQKGYVSESTYETIVSLVGDYARYINVADCAGNGKNILKYYKGRTVISETVVTDQQFLDLARDNQRSKAITYWKDYLNGISMIEHGVLKMCRGILDPRDVESKIGLLQQVEKERIQEILKDKLEQ